MSGAGSAPEERPAGEPVAGATAEPAGRAPAAGAAGEPEEDATVVVPARGRRAAAPVEAPEADETVAVPVRGRRAAGRPVILRDEGVAGSREPEDPATAADEPAADEPAADEPADDDATAVVPVRELPPELAKRMFKPPPGARRRVPRAPVEAPEHALPRRGVSPAFPVVSPTRSGRTAVRAVGSDPAAAFGPIPDSAPLPPAAVRDGLPSQARANRRFGIAALGGFAASIVVSVFGLWGVAHLAFG